MKNAKEQSWPVFLFLMNLFLSNNLSDWVGIFSSSALDSFFCVMAISPIPKTIITKVTKEHPLHYPQIGIMILELVISVLLFVDSYKWVKEGKTLSD